MAGLAPEQPKKPAGGAFGQFLSENRPEFQKACAGQAITAVTKMASAKWKELSEEAQKPYQKKYEEAKAKYDKDMEEFLAAGGEKAAKKSKKSKEEKKNGKKEKDPNKPKAPAGGAYKVFLDENRAKIVASLPKDHKMTDVSKAAAVQWKALPEKEKVPYETEYLKRRETYQKAMETYTPPAPVAPVVEEADGAVVETPAKKAPAKKRAAAEKATPSPAAKKGRVAKKAIASQEVEVDEKVLKEAEGLKLSSALKNLLGRSEVASCGKSHKDIFEVLKKNDGLVNKAKAILLGA